MGRHIKDFKRVLEATLVEKCKTELYSRKFRLLDHGVDDLEGLGCLEALDASLFERFYGHLRRAYRATSQRRGWGMENAVGVMNTNEYQKGKLLRRTDCMPNVELSAESGERNKYRADKVLPRSKKGEEHAHVLSNDLNAVAMVSGRVQLFLDGLLYFKRFPLKPHPFMQKSCL